MLNNTEFTSCPLPTDEIFLVLRILILLTIFSINFSHSQADNFVVLIRTPKYLKGNKP